MKQLIFLISTEGKSPDQLAKETWDAYQKFLKVEKELLLHPQKKASHTSCSLIAPKIENS